MPETKPSIDFTALENHSDGLIFFDSSGNFTGCSAKLEKLAGSEAAVRHALKGASWPRDFARGESGAVRESALMLSVSRTRPVTIRCLHTGSGFVAALKLREGTGAEGPEHSSSNFLREIFESLILERRAISRRLHGALSQDLVALALSLSSMRESGRDKDDSRLSEALAHVDRCCRGVRALSYVLAPPSFLNAGLIDTANWYAGVLRDDAGIDFTLDAAPLVADPTPEINDLFFAAIQHMAAAAIWEPQGASIGVVIRHERGVLSIRIECVCRSGEPVPESPLIRELAQAAGGTARFVARQHMSSLEISVPWVSTATAAV